MTSHPTPFSRMQPRLSILGASARAAAASAVRAGFRPSAVDLFADVDTQAMGPTTRIADYPQDFVKVAGHLPASPWIYTGSLENYPELIDAISANRPLWGNCGEVVRAVREPQIWTDVLQRAGFAVPRLANSMKDVPHDGSWLAKPRRSGGGFGIWPINEKYNWYEDGDATIYIQQRVQGTSASAVFVAAAGKTRLLGTTEQLSGTRWTGAPSFFYAGSIGPRVLRSEIVEKLTQLGDVLAGAFALRGLFGVDGILDEQTFWPIEINPRYTASVEVLERATGENFLQFHAAACRDAALPALTYTTASSHGKAIVYAWRNLTFTTEAADCVARLNTGQQWPVVADIPRIGEPIPRGSPIVTVFAASESHDDVVLRLKAHFTILRGAIDRSNPMQPAPRRLSVIDAIFDDEHAQ